MITSLQQHVNVKIDYEGIVNIVSWTNRAFTG